MSSPHPISLASVKSFGDIWSDREQRQHPGNHCKTLEWYQVKTRMYWKHVTNIVIKIKVIFPTQNENQTQIMTKQLLCIF